MVVEWYTEKTFLITVWASDEAHSVREFLLDDVLEITL